jgi:HEAT repeat protein
MRKFVLIVLSFCFLLGMATRKELENVKKTVETTTTAESTVGGKEIIPLENWERNKKVDKEVYKIAGELEELCEKNNNSYEAICWSPTAVKLKFKLEEMADKNPEEVLPPMYKIARDRKRSVLLRRLMIENLGYSKKPACVKALIDFLLDKSEEGQVRYDAAELLGRIIKDTTATPALIKTMEDKSNPERVRSEAAHAFVFTRDERAVKPLLGIIKSDPSLDVKRISISALGAIGRDTDNREMVNPLLEIVEKGGMVKKGTSDYSEIKTLQYHAISSLGAMKEERVVPLLSKMVESNDRNNLDVTIWALGNIGGAKAQNTLLKLLNHENEGVRFDAAKALLKMDDRSVVSDVEKVLPTLEVYHRNMITDSLQKFKER